MLADSVVESISDEREDCEYTRSECDANKRGEVCVDTATTGGFCEAS